MKKAVVLLLAITVALFAAGCQSETKTSSSTGVDPNAPFKIGAVVSVTGPAAPLGMPEKNALLLEVEKINKAGGINGKNVELIVEDDESDPKKANIAISRLIDEDKVVAVIGSTTSTSTLAMKAKAEQSQVPLMSMAAGIKITQKPAKYTFRTAQSDAVAVEKVLDYLMKKGLKKIAILHDSNAFGKSGAEELKKGMPVLRMKAVSTQSYNTNDTDMTSQLTKISGESPQAVVVWGTNPGPAIIAKNMKQLKMNIPYIGSHGIANKSFIELAGADAEGVVFPAGKVLVPETADGDQIEVIEEFSKDYKAKYGEAPNSFAGHAYDAIHIVTDALKEAGEGGNLLRIEIEKTWGFVGISGVFSYSADDHDGTKKADLTMIEIKNGEWIAAAE